VWYVTETVEFTAAESLGRYLGFGQFSDKRGVRWEEERKLLLIVALHAPTARKMVFLFVIKHKGPWLRQAIISLALVGKTWQINQTMLLTICLRELGVAQDCQIGYL
jgi:hypothetical protein